ncbi:EAL domain-containing protein [Chromobacterium sp. S0633]|uniref:EAL domain-containing response regulator n=1 Tax=Chromobacterium sp. S0633 TaxID=2957805 RepID=UPI00209E3D91|nr:EAL domain-containing protein [Chromobacterium sp. S0633]MCP1290541.1 EAL domain-containing protein [Chromobacterium sp. S0633]
MEPITAKPGPAPMRVLIVDDHDLQRCALSQALRQVGIDRIDEARDGADALERLQRHRYDLMISDLNMPGMDGILLLRHLSGLPAVPPIVFNSSLSKDMLMGAYRVAAFHNLPVIGSLNTPLSMEQLCKLWETVARRPAWDGASSDFDRQELERALRCGEILPWYQPQADSARLRVAGVEALARWRHPERGLLEPSAFLPGLEHYGLDEDLFFVIFRAAVEDYRRWSGQVALSGLRVSINLTASQFCNPDLPSSLAEAAEELGMAPALLTLELTETQRLKNIYQALENVIRLRMAGFRVSLDDVGCGYSGLEYLRELPVSAIKIDRSLVAGAADDSVAREILESTIRLAKDRNIQVVAEGIGEEADLQLMLRLGVDYVQGYLLGWPMPADEVPDYLRRRGQA